MIIAVVQGLALVGVPAIIMKLRNTRAVRTVGTIGVSYLLGIIVALIVFSINKSGVEFSLNSDVGEIGSHVAIGIAIPLLLFGADLKAARKLSKPVIIAFISLTVSVTVVSVGMFFAYGRTVNYGAELSGMAVGLYTGGTPNLNAIGSILGVDGTIIGLANLSDMIIGGVFYIFLLLLCKPLLKRFLPIKGNRIYIKEETKVDNYEDLSKRKLTDKKGLCRNILFAFLMAASGAAVGLLIWFLTGKKQGRMTDYVVPGMMIAATVFGIIGSFNKKIRTVDGNALSGQYLINVFSFGLAMSLDLNRLQADFLSLLLIYGVITVGAFLLHIVICKPAKIDVDCAMVTLTAGLYGPAFVPAITRQIKCDELTPAGLICGSVGYAIGTFLGLGVGALLRLTLPVFG